MFIYDGFCRLQGSSHFQGLWSLFSGSVEHAAGCWALKIVAGFEAGSRKFIAFTVVASC